MAAVAVVVEVWENNLLLCDAFLECANKQSLGAEDKNEGEETEEERSEGDDSTSQ